MKQTIKNPYKVNGDNIKTGDTFFIYHNKKFFEILFGCCVDLTYMFVNFPYEKRVKIAVEELYTKVPENWAGEVVKF